jgi:SlyX protein
LQCLKWAAELEKQAFPAHPKAQATLGNGLPAGDGYRDTSSLVSIVAATRDGACAADNGYTVEMNSDAIERLETKMAFLENANVELSDVVYRQSQEIQSLRARLDALAQRVEAAQTPEAVRTPEEERPPHY